MPKGTLFVQAHSDDMVMSSYFLIKSRILPKPHYLLTVFTKSNWVDPIKKKQIPFVKSVTAITNIRKREDKRFAKQLCLTSLFLNYKDCLLRHQKVFYQSDKKLDELLVKQVATSIECVIEKHKIKNVVVPFSYGAKQHYDHRVISEAINKFIAVSTMCNLYFIDDLPYGRITNAAKQNLKLFSKIKVGEISEKFIAMEIYDSQMCKLFFNQVQKITRQNQGYERIFVLNNK